LSTSRRQSEVFLTERAMNVSFMDVNLWIWFQPRELARRFFVSACFDGDDLAIAIDSERTAAEVASQLGRRQREVPVGADRCGNHPAGPRDAQSLGKERSVQEMNDDHEIEWLVTKWNRISLEISEHASHDLDRGDGSVNGSHFPAATG